MLAHNLFCKEEENLQIKQLNTGIRQIVNDTLNAAELYAQQFEAYKHLWCEKYSNVLNQLLKQALQKAKQQQQQMANGRKSENEHFIINKEYFVMEIFKREVSNVNANVSVLLTV